MHHALWWLIAALVLGIIEVGTVDFTFLMLAIGAGGASLASFFGASTAVQVGVFACVSVLLLVTARPWIKARVAASSPEVKTNAQALVGLQAQVVESVNAQDGRVRLAGELWSARTTGAACAVGEWVKVERIDGATAIVSAKAGSSSSDAGEDDTTNGNAAEAHASGSDSERTQS